MGGINGADNRIELLHLGGIPSGDHPAMYGDIMELALSTASTNIARQARYTVAIWQAEGRVDFRDQQTVAAITWLVQNTDAWTPENATALAG